MSEQFKEYRGAKQIDPSTEKTPDSSNVGYKIALGVTPRVLLVEDCIDTRELITCLLTDIGFEVSAVEDGKMCVERALAAHNGGTPYDAVLVDIGLPDIDGLAVTRMLRNSGYAHPIIAITIGPTLNTRWESLHSGCDDFLAKNTIHETIIPSLMRFNKKKRSDE